MSAAVVGFELSITLLEALAWVEYCTFEAIAAGTRGALGPAGPWSWSSPHERATGSGTAGCTAAGGAHVTVSPALSAVDALRGEIAGRLLPVSAFVPAQVSR